jgi:ABC-type branched-subunit amino acid transport system ATPase component
LTIPLLRLHDVSVDFGGLRAVDRVSLDVLPRQIVGIIGANGAGKSTLLNAISGSVRRSSGEVILDGVALARGAPAVARRGLARSFQHPRLLLNSTVRENLQCGLLACQAHPILARFWPGASAGGRAGLDSVANVAEAFSLQNIQDVNCALLSYGTQKLIDIARAFVGHPRMVLLDEPSSGLDTTETERLGAIIRAAADRDRLAVLFVEHDMELVRVLAREVVAMEAGAIVAQGETASVLDSLGLARRLMGMPEAIGSESTFSEGQS